MGLQRQAWFRHLSLLLISLIFLFFPPFSFNYKLILTWLNILYFKVNKKSVGLRAQMCVYIKKTSHRLSHLVIKFQLILKGSLSHHEKGKINDTFNFLETLRILWIADRCFDNVPNVLKATTTRRAIFVQQWLFISSVFFSIKRAALTD